MEQVLINLSLIENEDDRLIFSAKQFDSLLASGFVACQIKNG